MMRAVGTLAVTMLVAASFVPLASSLVAAQSFIEFPFPTRSGSGWSWRITAGPDGNLWFTEQYRNTIGRMTPAGVVTEFPVPTRNAAPAGITTGPDGNLWFTQRHGIGRITPV